MVEPIMTMDNGEDTLPRKLQTSVAAFRQLQTSEEEHDCNNGCNGARSQDFL